MEFIPGQTKRPKEITTFGVVIFEERSGDTFVETTVNKATCEAYGFKFNSFNNTCYAVEHDYLGEVTNENVTILGGNNIVNDEINNTIIAGNTNEVARQSQNNIINGSNHKIENFVSNANVSGIGAIATVNSETVIGSGSLEDTDLIAGALQLSNFTAIGQTTDTEPITLTVNNNGTSIKGAIYTLETNAIYNLEANILAIQTAANDDDGDSSNIVGRHKSFKLSKIIKCFNSGEISVDNTNKNNFIAATGFFTLTGTNITATKTHNITAARASTGTYNISFTNSLSSANYIVAAQIIEPDANRDDIKIHVKDSSQTASGFTLHIYEGDNGGSPDVSRDRSFYVTVIDTVDSGNGNLPVTPPTISTTDNNLAIVCNGLSTGNSVLYHAEIKILKTKINNSIA